ncbi:MAG: DUF3363 domain-containing protein [Pseudomonadota bacterium]
MAKTPSGHEFEVSLGRIRSDPGDRRLRGFLKKVAYGAKRAARRSRGLSSSVARAQFQRRVIVKITSVKMTARGAGAQALHLDYLERSGAGADGSAPELYTDDHAEFDKEAFLAAGQEDRHQFRMILSPEDAGELADLSAFTRDLVKEMERDLGTKLVWGAANHFDTDQPHTHVVIRGRRDDGTDLVMPRRYITQGIRERAQDLVALELGPVTELAGRVRLAKMVAQERWTQLDTEIEKRTNGGLVDLCEGSEPNQKWRQRLYSQRLKRLSDLNLAVPQGRRQWRVQPDIKPTLRRMGERGDVIKALNQSLRRVGRTAPPTASMIFDSTSASARPVTGKIIAKGVADDINDCAYLVVESLKGQPTYVGIGGADQLEDYEAGQVVTVSPANSGPRPSDHVIAKIAARNQGRYSTQLHMKADARAQPAYIEAHVRRLEALRRARHVTRHQDGSWHVPKDYLDRAAAFETAQAVGRPAVISRQSHLTVSQMETAIGSTWLDSDLRDRKIQTETRGFGTELEQARTRRRAFLVQQGFIASVESKVTDKTLVALKEQDLAQAARQLSSKLGKSYAPAIDGDRVDGKYHSSIDRPSGKFAIVEHGQSFVLVPWREVLERNRGKGVSGIMRKEGITWQISKGRSL